MVKISENFTTHQLHKMVDVKISHVYSPEEFWVQRCDRNGRLGALEEEMFKFYEDEDNNKSIEEMPFPGRFEFIILVIFNFIDAIFFWKLQWIVKKNLTLNQVLTCVSHSLRWLAKPCLLGTCIFFFQMLLFFLKNYEAEVEFLEGIYDLEKNYLK